MAVVYTDAVKTQRITATRDHFADGTLEILTSTDTVLVTFNLTLAGGSVATDTWTLEFDNATVAATASGTATKAQIKTSGGTADLTGLTVSTTGADINLDNDSINSGQNVTLNSATIQHAA